MKRIRIICLEDDREDVVASLHRLGTLDLRKSELNLSDAAPSESSSTISDLLIKFEGAIQPLPKAAVKLEKHRTTGIIETIKFKFYKKIRDC